jgi:hypothetical protein
VQSGVDIFTDFSIEELKQEFKCEYRRAKDGSSNCKTALGKAKYSVEKLAELIEACKDEELTKAYQQLKGLVGLKRAEEQKREAEEKAKADAESKKSKETDKTVEMLKKQGMPEELIKMYLANRK